MRQKRACRCRQQAGSARISHSAPREIARAARPPAKAESCPHRAAERRQQCRPGRRQAANADAARRLPARDRTQGRGATFRCRRKEGRERHCLSSRERNALFICRRGSFLRFPARAPCRPASARIRCAEGAASRRRRRSVCFCPFLSPPSDIIRQLYSVIIHHIG